MIEFDEEPLKDEDLRALPMKLKVRDTKEGELPAVQFNHEGAVKAVLCGWFRNCTKDATSWVNHPVLGAVPVCQQHFEFSGARETVVVQFS